MNIDPKTPKRICGGIVAMAAIGVAFKVCTPDEAKAVADNTRPVLEAIVAVIGFFAGVWHPKHKDTK